MATVISYKQTPYGLQPSYFGLPFNKKTNRYLPGISYFNLVNNACNIACLAFHYKTYSIEHFSGYFYNSPVFFHPFAAFIKKHGHHRILPDSYPACFYKCFPELVMAPVCKAQYCFFIAAAMYFGDKAQIVT